MIRKLRAFLVSSCSTMYAVTAWTILLAAGCILAITAAILATVFEATALLKKQSAFLNSSYLNKMLMKVIRK